MFDSRRETLKLFAIITMVFDHISLFWFPEYTFLRIPGRLCVAVYAFLIASGYDLTRSHLSYVWRLLFLALLSQFGYYLTGHSNLNIIFSFCLAVSIIGLWKSGFHKLSFLLLLSVFFLPLSYNFYAVFLVLGFRLFSRYRFLGLIFIFLLTVFYCGFINNTLQLWSIVSLPVILYLPAIPDLRINSWLWRYFYPVHWLILFAIIP